MGACAPLGREAGAAAMRKRDCLLVTRWTPFLCVCADPPRPIYKAGVEAPVPDPPPAFDADAATSVVVCVYVLHPASRAPRCRALPPCLVSVRSQVCHRSARAADAAPGVSARLAGAALFVPLSPPVGSTPHPSARLPPRRTA